MIERVEFLVLVEPGYVEEWRVSCEIEGRTNAGHVDFNVAQCWTRTIDDEAEFLAYCEQHGVSVDLHALAHEARERRYAGRDAS